MRTNSDMVGRRTPGSAYGIATLDSNTKVVEDPANATATPTAGKIPIADGSGTLNGWIQPIWDKTVTGSAVTSVTTDGEVTLDANAHGGYLFEFIIVEPASTGLYYRLYYNNDTTNTNYNTLIMRNDIAGADAVAANDSYIIRSTVTASKEIHIRGDISISPSGIVTYKAVSTGNYGSVSGSINIMYERTVQLKIATVTNLTRIDVVASAASSIGVNSRFRLWRRM